jgi:hypothetical protein
MPGEAMKKGLVRAAVIGLKKENMFSFSTCHAFFILSRNANTVYQNIKATTISSLTGKEHRI